MPKVLFVNEHREVEVKAGRTIASIAEDFEIAVCRQHFKGVPFGDWTVWVKGEEGCISSPTFVERFVERCRGQKRLANHTRVLGDCRVVTQAGLAGRTTMPRAISPPPNPSEDPAAERFDHPNNAAGTAWNVYGHPKAVASGTREPPKYEPPKKRARKAKAAKAEVAAPEAAAAPAPAEDTTAEA